MGNGPKERRIQMLKCQICAARVDVLAHQIRGSVEVTVCLDCANRYYQDQLTKTLIANEKAVA
jgi:ribosome-binding protein aMBF1 (putative translation factor)